VSGELVYFIGGFDPYIDAADRIYEEQLKECRLKGHDLSEGWADGMSFFVCDRCKTRWVEDP
jgi:hypothetical protein